MNGSGESDTGFDLFLDNGHFLGGDVFGGFRQAFVFKTIVFETGNKVNMGVRNTKTEG